MVKLFFSKVIDSKRCSKDFVREIVAKELGVHKGKLHIAIDEFGKPYLKDHENFHFNISHTKGAIVCALSDNPVGVDIEKIKPFNRGIIDRFFTQSERTYIYLSYERQNERFIEIWTRKEAYVKWIGKGIEIPFNSFDVLRNSKITTKYIDDYVISICSNNFNELYQIENMLVYKSMDTKSLTR